MDSYIFVYLNINFATAPIIKIEKVKKKQKKLIIYIMVSRLNNQNYLERIKQMLVLNTL